MGPGARASDSSGSSNSSNQAVRRETARTGRAIRQAGHPGARGVWRPTGLPQADRRVEGPPPILERRNDDRRPQRHGARDGPLEADLERGSARVGADRRVHIRHWGACAPKRHFDVRASASLCCWLSYSCGTAAGTVLPLRGTRPLTGATPQAEGLVRARGRVCFHNRPPPSKGRSHPSIPPGRGVVQPSTTFTVHVSATVADLDAHDP